MVIEIECDSRILPAANIGFLQSRFAIAFLVARGGFT